MAGYTRQSIADIINGSEVTAPPINAEFNQIASAFNGSTGHSHDGSTGNAPKINLATSLSGYLPAVHGGTGGKNNFSATANPAVTDDAGDGYAPGSLWENTTTGRMFICVGNTANAAVWRELVQVETNNVIKPISHNTIDLGTPTVRFQDLYLQGGISSAGNASLGGTLNVTGATTLTGAATANGGLTVNGATTLAGNVTIGDALSTLDTIAVAAGFTSNLVPDANAGVSLGTSTKQWNNLYLDGTATIDTLTVDDNATVAGTLGVTGTSTLSTANITNITATGTINLAGATVSNLGSVTTAAIGGGSLNNVVIGGSTPAAITGTTITGTSLVGPLTGNVLGNVTGNLTGNVLGDVTGDLTGNVTATSGTSNFTNVTISGQLNMDASSSGTITNLTAPSSDLDAATKKYVDDAIDGLLDGAPGTLDTLNELAAAINDDASAYNTLNTAIGNKLPKSGGTMSGAINMGGQRITNAANPTAAQDLATKHYIDTTYIDYSSAADAANDAEKLAVNAEDVQYTLSDGSTTGYSALHYAAKAAASYDSFDDRYLGSKASDPTLDNDNNALITGALYFDSTNGVMKVYNGTEWANASSSIEGIKSNFYYTATSGQTAFSGSDDNSNTLVIDAAGLVNVYMNGVRLHEDDYTVSAAGDSVTLAAGAATGDLIYLEVFGNFAGQSGADVAITGGSITGLSTLGVTGTGVDPNVIISNTTNGDVSLTLRRVSANDAYTDWTHMNDGGRFKLISDDNINNDAVRMQVDYTGDISFYDDSNNAKLFWDASAESLKLGSTSTVFTDPNIDIEAGTASGRQAGIWLRSNSGNSVQQINVNNNILEFGSGGSTDTSPTMSIVSTGYVGINQTAPNAHLHIKGSFEGTYALKLDNTMGDGTAEFGYRSHGTNGETLALYDIGQSRKLVTYSGTHAQTVFNEDSHDYDFRVESDSNTHMLFVDGGNNAVGIGVNSVSSDILTVGGSAYFKGTGSAIRFDKHGNAGSDNALYYANNSATNALYLGRDSGEVHIRTSGSTRLQVAGATTTFNSKVAIRDDSLERHDLDQDNVGLVFNYNGYQGSNTRFRDFSIFNGKHQIITKITGASDLLTHYGHAVFNEGSEDRDFRVESNNNTHMLYVDAGHDVVSFGTSSTGQHRDSDSSSLTDLHVGSVAGFGSYVSVGTAAQNNAGYIGFNLTSLPNSTYYYPQWAENSSAGGAMIKMPSGGNGGLEFYTAKFGADYSGQQHSDMQQVMRMPDTGGLIINDGGGNYDFRVESDAYAHMFFVDSGANQVRLGTSASTQAFSVTAPQLEVTTGGSGGGGVGIKSDSSTSSTKAALSIWTRANGSGSTAYALGFYDGPTGTAEGSITVSNSGTTYNTTSDRRLKTDIQPIVNGTEKLMAMNPVTHKWKADPHTGETVHGFIAQEMQEIVPEAVSGDPDGEEMMSMDYGRITPVLVAALQDAHKKIEALEERLAELEAK